MPGFLLNFHCNLWTLFFGTVILFPIGCSSYQPFTAREFSWQLNAPKSNNPIFVEAQDHEFLWSVLVDVVDSHYPIAREMPIRLYGNVLTEGHLETKPQIGASLGEVWHADSVGMQERFDCTLQTIRRRVEVHVVPENGGFLIDVKVFKELEDNNQPLRAVSNVANLRFRDDVNDFADQIDINPSSAGWFIIERDTAAEDRLLQEIVYRLKNPSSIIRQSKEPIRG
jgi:hypothetical protein